MTKPKINPHLLQAGYQRWQSNFAGVGKSYLPTFSGFGRKYIPRKHFRTANKALAYAKKILDRWRRLYDTALEIHISSVARTDESGGFSQVIAPFEQESSHERPTKTVAEFRKGGA